MNKELTNQIIRHIYQNLGIKTTNQSKNKFSILNQNFLLKKKIKFEGIDQNIWGIQFEIEKGAYLQVAAADCSQNNFPEYAIMVALQDTPSYACYLAYQELAPPDLEIDRPMIACQVKDDIWTEASMYMQSSFLCGMEKIRDIPAPFSKLKQESIADKLTSFVEFYQDKMEQENEGQEI